MSEPLTDELLNGLNLALNESDLQDVVVRPERREAAVLVAVLSLPEVGPEPEDRRVLLRLTGISRVVASLRLGRWDDDTAHVVDLSLDDLSDTLRSFGAQPIYGWEFIDPPAEGWQQWNDRLSLDVTFADTEAAHVLELFQESGAGPARHLDMRLWFDGLGVYDFGWNPLSLPAVIEGARRWWAAMRAGDPRTQGHGIVPG